VLTAAANLYAGGFHRPAPTAQRQRTASLAGTVQATFASVARHTATPSSRRRGRIGTFGSLTTSALPRASRLAELHRDGRDPQLVATLGGAARPAVAVPRPEREPGAVAGASTTLQQRRHAAPASRPVQPHRRQPRKRLTCCGRTGDRQPAGRVQADGPVLALYARSVRRRPQRGGAPADPRSACAEREALPEDIARAYAKVMRHRRTRRAGKLRAALDVWRGNSAAPTGRAAIRWWSAATILPRAMWLCPGLTIARPRDTVLGFALAGAAPTGRSPRASAAEERRVPGRRLRRDALGPAYLAASLAFANHWMSTDRFAALPITSRPASMPRVLARGGDRLSLRDAGAGITPYAAAQAQSFRRRAIARSMVPRRLCARLQRPHLERSAHELGARFDQ